jgi:predicted GNAT family N-acyltransferase
VDKISVKKVKTREELEQVFNIRKKVFIEEQNVPKDIELDEFDENAEHFIAYLEDKPIGCSRVRFNDLVKLERIAIIKEHRNKGYGTFLTGFMIKYCKQKNSNGILIHSQVYVEDFYKKFGFKIIDEPFYEAGIEHVKMVLK